MKKQITLILSALALLGASALWAATTPELATTDVFDGQRVYLSGQWIANLSESNPDGVLETPYYLGVLTPSAQPDSLHFGRFQDGTPGESYTFTLEAAGKKIMGIEAYYIKNDFSGKYLHKGAEENSDCADLWLTDKGEATAWAVFKAAEHTDVTGYDQSKQRAIPDEAMQIMTLGADGSTPYFVTYNGVFSVMYKQMYPDYFWYVDQTMAMTTVDAQTWFCMETVAMQDDPTEDLRNAVNTAKSLQRPGGTDPGFYDPSLVETLSSLIDEANDLMDTWGVTDEQIQDMTNQLTAAIEALTNCQPNPMADGYYYLVNGAYDLDAMGESEESVKLAIRDTEQGTPGWHRLDTQDPAYVWHLTKRADGQYDAENLMTGQFLDVAESPTSIAMAQTSTKGMSISLQGTEATFALALYDNTGKAFTPLYASNYTQRALYDAEGSTLMLRSSGGRTAGSWYLNTVPADILAELLAEAPTIQLRNQLSALIAKSAALYNVAVKYEPSENLITDPSQLESNAGMGPESEWGEDGGGLAALIDNDASTYFHTAWTANIPTETVTAADGTEQIVAQKHWLAVILPEPVDVISLIFTRRTPTNDNTPSDFDLLGSNDEVNWTTIYEGYNGFDPTLADVTTLPNLPLGAKYQMLRMVVNHTNGSRGIDRTSEEGGAIYWNMAELRVCGQLQLTPTCQAASMPTEAVTGLAEALVNARRALAKPTQADIDALQQAFDAFKTVYVDAEPLTNLIAEAEQISQDFETGNGLGYYAEGTTNPLPQLIEQAREVIEATAYTAATIDQQVTALTNAMNTLALAMQQTPDPTKYYTIHFPSMDDYGVYGWDTSNSMNEEQGYYLFDTQAAIASSADEGIEVNDVRRGATIFFRSPEDIEEEQLAQFRFIPQADGGYLIQNRATGLYLYGNKNSYAPLSLTYSPSLAQVKGLGHGKVQVELSTPDGTPIGNLYAQLFDRQMSVGTFSGLGSNSALELHEVEDETVNESDIELAPIDVQIAVYYAMCYPLSVSCEEGEMYVVAGQTEQDGTTYIGLKEVEQVGAGEPFVYVIHIDGVTYNNHPTADDSLAVQFRFGTELASQPLEQNHLRGSFASAIANQGESVLLMDAVTGMPKWNTIHAKSTYNERLLSSCSALLTDWTDLPAMAASDADLLIAINNSGSNAIATITDQQRQSGIFDLQGRRVNSRNVQLPKGIYIIDGKKYVRK